MYSQGRFTAPAVFYNHVSRAFPGEAAPVFLFLRVFANVSINLFWLEGMILLVVVTLVITTLKEYKWIMATCAFLGSISLESYCTNVFALQFFKYVKWNKIGNNFEKIIFFLSKYTFGIYLIHMYFVLSLPNLLKLNSSSFCWRTIGSVFIFAISSVICYLISCIPIIRRCIGV